VRAAINADIMFMTPVGGAGDPCAKGSTDAQDDAFTNAMRRLCEDEKVEFVDMKTPWKDLRLLVR
jgi:hypothetical protein